MLINAKQGLSVTGYSIASIFAAVKVISLFHHPEHGHADIPTFYTCDEGLSALTQEGQATLERLEGMLAQSVTQQYHMAGVRTEETKAEFEGLNQTHTKKPGGCRD